MNIFCEVVSVISAILLFPLGIASAIVLWTLHCDAKDEVKTAFVQPSHCDVLHTYEVGLYPPMRKEDRSGRAVPNYRRDGGQAS